MFGKFKRFTGRIYDGLEILPLSQSLLLGILVCGTGAGFGGDEHAGKFQKCVKNNLWFVCANYLLQRYCYVKAKFR